MKINLTIVAMISSSLITLLISTNLLASPLPKGKDFNFIFKAGRHILEIKKMAPSKEMAFKLAAKECYHALSGGKYPGEERGLDIIDICANPKM